MKTYCRQEISRGDIYYRRSFWTHRPLTDFWRVGKGYAAKLEAHGLYTMGDIARCSIGKFTDYHNEELLYIVSTGRLKRIHEVDQVLVLADGLRIPIGDIVELESECIRGLL